MDFNKGDRVVLKPDGSELNRPWYPKYIGQVGRVEELHDSNNYIYIRWFNNPIPPAWWYKVHDVLHEDMFNIKSIDILFEDII